MAKHFAYGLTSKGATRLITEDLSEVRHIAERQARAECKKEGLTFQYIAAVKGTSYNGTPQHKSLFKRIAAERSKK